MITHIYILFEIIYILPMKKIILLITIAFTCLLNHGFAQPKTNTDKTQYMLIVRFKTDFKPTSAEQVQNNIKHWQEFMGNLAQSGDLVSGYRPAVDGLTISGSGKTVESIPYTANGELISSVLIIKALSMDAAKDIASKCPVFELGGSIEVRPLTDVAGK